jgi:hypothetical protein
MRILLTKLSDLQHRLDIVRHDGSRETIELVTREALFHDLLHFAVEASMPTQGGFWGALASGKRFADLNDRSGESVADIAATLWMVEGAVGMMTRTVELPPEQGWEKLRDDFEHQGLPLPPWCSQPFVTDCCERMRQMLGHWKATPFGETMEIVWPEPEA